MDLFVSSSSFCDCAIYYLPWLGQFDNIWTHETYGLFIFAAVSHAQWYLHRDHHQWDRPVFICDWQCRQPVYVEGTVSTQVRHELVLQHHGHAKFDVGTTFHGL